MTPQSAYWVHDLDPFLLRFPDNPLGIEGIRYYGLAYLLGFLAAWWLLGRYSRAGRLELNADQRSSLMTAVILGVLAGGRLGYLLLYDLTAFLNNPLILLRVDEGGMASHGGFIGVILAVYWFARRQGSGFYTLGDVLVTVAPFGLMLGRMANFINGELWGRVAHFQFAVIFPDSPAIYDPTSGYYGPPPRHPSQLYEAFLEGGLLLAYTQWRFWRCRTPAGQLSGEFLFGYGVVRIIGEIFRQPDAELIFNISRGQFYSLFMIAAGALLIYQARKRSHLPGQNPA